MLSELSVNCFNAKIAELAIKNTIPKYIAINTTIVEIPTLESTNDILLIPSRLIPFTSSGFPFVKSFSIFSFPSSVVAL